jgi:hypothetical protein
MMTLVLIRLSFRDGMWKIGDPTTQSRVYGDEVGRDISNSNLDISNSNLFVDASFVIKRWDLHFRQNPRHLPGVSIYSAPQNCRNLADI